MKEAAAIIGVGQTQYRRRHQDLNTAELVRQAAMAALNDAGLGLDDIGLIVGGVAPDALAGINHLDMHAIPRPGIPYFRVNTGGATGSSALLAALSWIHAGRCKAVLVVAVERMGHATTAARIFNSIFDPIYEKDISMSTISMVALRATLLMQKYGYTLEHWAGLAARNSAASQLNDTLEHPRLFTAAEVLKSKFLAWPIHSLEACPTNEGACAVVVTAASMVGRRNAAWILGARGLSDTYAMGDRMHRPEGSLVDLLTLRRSAQAAYSDAGITDPLKELDVVEIQAPFASSEAMAYPSLGLCQASDGVAFTERAIEQKAGISINPSGGPQASNPVSATALIRIAECAQQVRGLAGRRQVDGARKAIATGQGGATQFSTAVILSNEKP
jgi:acetyl-CoA C-acetyltransferase